MSKKPRPAQDATATAASETGPAAGTPQGQPRADQAKPKTATDPPEDRKPPRSKTRTASSTGAPDQTSPAAPVMGSAAPDESADEAVGVSVIGSLIPTLLLGIVVTGLAFASAALFVQRVDTEARIAQAGAITARVQNEFTGLETSLSQVVSAMEAVTAGSGEPADAISPTLFQALADPALERHPMVETIAFLPQLVDSETAMFEAMAHAEALLSYRRPSTPNGRAEQLFFPIRHVAWAEPKPAGEDRSGTSGQIGSRLIPRDTMAGPQAVQAMATAIERTGMAVSGLIVEGRQEGFNVLNGLSMDTVGQRRTSERHVFWLMQRVEAGRADRLAGLVAFKIVLDRIVRPGTILYESQVALTSTGAPAGQSPTVYWMGGTMRHAVPLLPTVLSLSDVTASQPLAIGHLDLAVVATVMPSEWDRDYVLPASVLAFGLLAMAFSSLRILYGYRRQLDALAERHRFAERIEAQRRELEANEARFHHLIESTNVVPWEADLKSQRFTYVGPQVEQVVGYPVSAWYSHGFWLHHVHPHDRQDALYSLTDLNQQPSIVREYRMRRADGSIMWVRNAITEVPDEADEGKTAAGRGDAKRGPRRVQGFLIDITEQRRAQAALMIAKEAAERANRTKSDFLANMSHELRTPMNSIIGFSEMMKDRIFGPIGDNRYEEYVENIHTSARHLLDLINDILDLSKIEAGRFEIQEEEIDLTSLLRSCHTFLKERAKRSGVHLKVTADEDLPDIYADGRRLKQVLLNLLTNGVKFTPPGGSVALEASLTGEGGDLRLAVRDTGIGMKPEDIPRALEKFSQIDSSLNRQHDGTGLGLPIARSLVELHSGTLNLESKYGQGTVVTILLPKARLLTNRSKEKEDEAKKVA